VLTTRRLATLDVSAASGLVQVGDRWYVIADDELSLAVYDGAPAAARPAGHVPLFADRPPLPAEHAARKAAKPDLEALVDVPGAGLVALGSGSTPARSTGTVLRHCISPEYIDLAPLHAALRTRFPELNLEGAAVAGNFLYLLQRGNGPQGENALVALSLAAVQAALAAGAPWTPALVHAIRPVALGTHAGGALGFTDACGLPDGRIVFSAAAEASASTYEDGVVAGSVVGLLAPDGRVLSTHALDILCKVEGLHATPGPAGIDLYLVCDADDRAVPSPLLHACLPE
jgi:hypothetical protein